MKQHIAAVTLLVPGYDEAIAYYVGKLGFRLVEDTALSATKRWVVVAPPGNGKPGLLLARADSPNQRQAIGNQTGGRVFLILKTDDFDRDYARFKQAGIEFLEAPPGGLWQGRGVSRCLREQVGSNRTACQPTPLGSSLPHTERRYDV